MQPFFTNDAVLLGLLMMILAFIFSTSSSDSAGWKKFYRYCPTVLLCYFIPALLHWPLGLIAYEWYSYDLLDFLSTQNISAEGFRSMSFESIKAYLTQEKGISPAELEPFHHHSELYYMASRYLLPASLILLCLGIDFQGILNLGPKALMMFLAASLGIIIGGPIALAIVMSVNPDIVGTGDESLWKGLSTVAGSWIGGGANQTAMKEIFGVSDGLFASMIIIDVVVANIWLGFLLYGAGISDRIDRWLKADSSAIEDLKKRIENYRAGVEQIPTTASVFVLLGVAFGGVALSHWGSDVIVPYMKSYQATLESARLNSLLSGFFWLIVIATTIGLGASFTKFRKLEGVGASRWGSVCIYVLVATIGMKMNLGEVGRILGLFSVGLLWMLIHVVILLVVAKLIKAPFFFVAVGSQANVGGAASAPVVASAFSPSLASVGALMAVLGYALGTYGAIICAYLMQAVSG